MRKTKHTIANHLRFAIKLQKIIVASKRAKKKDLELMLGLLEDAQCLCQQASNIIK